MQLNPNKTYERVENLSEGVCFIRPTDEKLYIYAGDVHEENGTLVHEIIRISESNMSLSDYPSGNISVLKVKKDEDFGINPTQKVEVVDISIDISSIDPTES